MKELQCSWFWFWSEFEDCSIVNCFLFASFPTTTVSPITVTLCVCVCVCVRACVRACVRVRVYVCVRVCVHARAKGSEGQGRYVMQYLEINDVCDSIP